MNKTGEIAMGNVILRGEVGSTAHGTGLPGHEDVDHMGVFVEPPENVCGPFPVDHHVYRTAGEGQRSQPGDLDLTMYSLRRYCELAVKGNPSVTLLLWLPSYVVETELGRGLVGLREAFISRQAGERYLGYLISQRKALTGERGKKVTRPDLVEAHGYDTKFAMHALRLGLQGLELLMTGHLTMPICNPNGERLREVRRGEHSFAAVMGMIKSAETRLRVAVKNCDREVDLPRVKRFLVEAHRRHWEEKR